MKRKKMFYEVTHGYLAEGGCPSTGVGGPGLKGVRAAHVYRVA